MLEDMLIELGNHLEYIHSMLKLSQEKLDKLELEMEQHSERHNPSQSQMIDYLFKRGIMREHISHLKGKEDMICELQNKIRVNQTTNA